MPAISSPIWGRRSMRFRRICATALLLSATSAVQAATQAADTAYRHGVVYTVDARDSRQQSLAIRSGRIVYGGADAGSGAFIGPQTKIVDLRGKMVMPGLVDGHQHPLQGGAALL